MRYNGLRNIIVKTIAKSQMLEVDSEKTKAEIGKAISRYSKKVPSEQFIKELFDAAETINGYGIYDFSRFKLYDTTPKEIAKLLYTSECPEYILINLASGNFIDFTDIYSLDFSESLRKAVAKHISQIADAETKFKVAMSAWRSNCPRIKDMYATPNSFPNDFEVETELETKRTCDILDMIGEKYGVEIVASIVGVQNSTNHNCSNVSIVPIKNVVEMVGRSNISDVTYTKHRIKVKINMRNLVTNPLQYIKLNQGVLSFVFYHRRNPFQIDLATKEPRILPNVQKKVYTH